MQYYGHTNTGEGKVGLVCSYLRRTDETAHGCRFAWFFVDDKKNTHTQKMKSGNGKEWKIGALQ